MQLTHELIKWEIFTKSIGNTFARVVHIDWRTGVNSNKRQSKLFGFSFTQAARPQAVAIIIFKCERTSSSFFRPSQIHRRAYFQSSSSLFDILYETTRSYFIHIHSRLIAGTTFPSITYNTWNRTHAEICAEDVRCIPFKFAADKINTSERFLNDSVNSWTEKSPNERMAWTYSWTRWHHITMNKKCHILCKRQQSSGGWLYVCARDLQKLQCSVCVFFSRCLRSLVFAYKCEQCDLCAPREIQRVYSLGHRRERNRNF